MHILWCLLDSVSAISFDLKVTAFGGIGVTKLLQAIERNQHKFSIPPIGPIGAHVVMFKSLLGILHSAWVVLVDGSSWFPVDFSYLSLCCFSECHQKYHFILVGGEKRKSRSFSWVEESHYQQAITSKLYWSLSW